MGHRGSLNGCGKSRTRRDLIPGRPSPQRVAIPTELSYPGLIITMTIIIVIIIIIINGYL